MSGHALEVESAEDTRLGRLRLAPLAPSSWDELLADYRAAAARDGLRASTIGVHLAHVRDLARRTDLQLDEMTAIAICEWLARPTWCYRTRKAHRASVAAVFGWAVSTGVIARNPVEGVYASQLEASPSSPSAAHDGDYGDADRVAGGLTEHPARLWARRAGYPHASTGRVAEDLLEAWGGGRGPRGRAWAAAGAPRPNLVGASAAAAWARLLDDYEVAARAGGLRETTTRTRRFHLEHVARETGLAPEELEVDDLVEWQGREGLAPATRRSIRSSLRVVLGWAHRTGRIPSNPAENLPRVRVPGGVPRPATETAIRDAVNRASPKQRLMLLLAAYEGLRRAEIARLRVEDLTPGGWHVTGKGGSERLVPLHAALVEELAAYLEHTAISASWLFPNPEGTGHLSIEHIGTTTSRLLPPGVSLHKLRHRFASQAYASAYDIRSVQELLGHSSPAVTARYVAVPTPQLEAAVLAVPPIPGIDPARTDRRSTDG